MQEEEKEGVAGGKMEGEGKEEEEEGQGEEGDQQGAEDSEATKER